MIVCSGMPKLVGMEKRSLAEAGREGMTLSIPESACVQSVTAEVCITHTVHACLMQHEVYPPPHPPEHSPQILCSFDLTTCDMKIQHQVHPVTRARIWHNTQMMVESRINVPQRRLQRC